MKTLVILLALLGALPAHAQTSMYREVPKGEVTGLEMGIEGALRVSRGGRLRWFVTVYEVVHGRTLRPAADATLSAQASFHRKEPLAKALTDVHGRAQLAIDIPADEELGRSFSLAVKVRAKQVTRQFDVTIEVAPRYRTELEVDRQVFAPGETIFTWGRVMDETLERPAAHREVRVAALAKNGQPIAAAVTLTTDAAGVFHHWLPAPAAEGASFAIEAALTDGTASAKKAGLTTARVKLPALVVKCAPLTPVVAPGTQVQVDVVVRTADGRPVPRAGLTGLSLPSGKAKPVPQVFTDDQGRARLPWEVSTNEALADVTGEVQAVREGYGTGSGKVQVRVSRRTHTLSWAVEGGTLVPGLPGQLIVRLHRPDGQPLVDTALRLTGGRLTPATARTDDQGVAVLATTLGPARAAASASCTGDTVAAALLHLGAEEEELCLPVDPDATVRVQAPLLLEAGRAVGVRLQRVAAVAQAPVEVALLKRQAAGHWLPIAQAIAAAGSSRILLEVPAEALGLLWLRARPLVGPLRQEIRGGGLTVWSTPGRAPRLGLSPGKGEVQVTLDEASSEASGFILALPVAAGQELLARLGDPTRAPGSFASLGQLQGYLAAQTPTDEVVSAVLRDGVIMPLPAPADPVVQGRLRDPRRAQERFVRGRLARILKAIEQQIEHRIPDKLDAVAFHGPGGWRFNREILNLLLPELQAEGLVGLDGSPLTIEALQALDPAITYDNAARRITRERLFQLYFALEHFVRRKELGYAWARRGDPGRWLLGLIDGSDAGEHDQVKRETLFDAWGHPFALQRIRGEKARFRFLEPVPGWEIVSAGPDGRLDTADDLAAPFARILASGTIYGEAVGEDLLLSRLQQVELGRATIGALGEVFDIKAAEQAEPETEAPRSSWSEPPARLAEAASALAPVVVGEEPATGGFYRLAPAANRVPLALSAAPRGYLLVAGAYSASGVAAFGSSRFAGGVPLLLEVAAPERLRSGEKVRVPISLTYLGPPQKLRVQVEAAGSLRVSAATAPMTLSAGDARTIELALTATQRGSGRVRVTVADASGAVLMAKDKTVQVVGDGVLGAQHTGRLVLGSQQARLTPPAGAEALSAQLFVSGARDLIADPGFAGLAQTAPALAAWAYGQRGQPAPAPLAAALSAWAPGSGSMAALQVACAVVAFSAAPSGVGPTAELTRALKWMETTRPVSWQERSAVLVALAAGVAAATAEQSGSDPVATLLRQIREESWESLATEQGHPTVMARLAAGLLLSDRRDAIGRELFERARATMQADREEGAVDAWIGTAALAVAARQLGEDALATELAHALAPRLYLGMRDDAEASFWLLAASAYGVFGAATPDEVEVRVDGLTRRLKLTGGSATLKLPTPGAQVTVSSELPVLLRLAACFRQAAAASSAAPLSVRIDGHVGHAAETAALELTVEGSGKQPIARPVIELELPGLGTLSDEARARLAAAPGLLRVDAPDLAGVVRIYLAPLDPQKPRRLPLPIHWLGAGQVSGLAITAYDADQPWRLTTLPARQLAIQPATKESW